MSDNKGYCIDWAGTLTAYNGTDKSVVIPDDVRRIGEKAFYANATVETVVVGGGVERISESAFEGCLSLKCLVLEEGVKHIADSAIAGCPSLRILSLPDSLVHIGAGNFERCESLEYTVYDGAKYLGNDSNPLVALVSVDPGVEELLVPEGVSVVCSGACYGCSRLSSVHLAEGVRYVGSEAFAGCSSLSRIALPESWICISSRAFGSISPGKLLIPAELGECRCEISPGGMYGDISLENVAKYVASNALVGDRMCCSVYDGGWYVGDETNPYLCLVLAADKKAVEFRIHRDTRLIYKAAFLECYDLERVEMPEDLVKIGAEAFKQCYSLVRADLPRGLCEIGAYAFISCYSLADVELPNGKLVIGNGAFCACKKIKRIELCDATVHDSAFSSCTRLGRVKIGKGTKLLGDYVFSQCPFITDVTVSADSRHSIGKEQFADSRFVKIKYE